MAEKHYPGMVFVNPELAEKIRTGDIPTTAISGLNRETGKTEILESALKAWEENVPREEWPEGLRITDENLK